MEAVGGLVRTVCLTCYLRGMAQQLFFILWIPNVVHKMTEVVPQGAKMLCSLLPSFFLGRFSFAK